MAIRYAPVTEAKKPIVTTTIREPAPAPSPIEIALPAPRSKGGRPLAKDAHKSLAATRPWEAEGMSRRTWFRRRAEARQ